MFAPAQDFDAGNAAAFVFGYDQHVVGASARDALVAAGQSDRILQDAAPGRDLGDCPRYRLDHGQRVPSSDGRQRRAVALVLQIGIVWRGDGAPACGGRQHPQIERTTDHAFAHQRGGMAHGGGIGALKARDGMDARLPR